MYQRQPYAPCNPMADLAFTCVIPEYIHDELKDSRYYSILARKAPTRRARELLMEFSRDEETHARNFRDTYSMLTGRTPNPPMVEEPNVPEYQEALKQRILAETSDYKKYGIDYLRACRTYLKDLFFMTRTIEAQHAMRMPLLMAEARMG